jgi:hypothetical protein
MGLRTLSAALIGLAQAPSMWGGLEPGPYAVGVRELLLHDAARPSLQTEDGALVSGESGRQMQIVVVSRPTHRRPVTHVRVLRRAPGT